MNDEISSYSTRWQQMLFTWVTLKMDTVKVKWNLCCPIPRGSFGIFLWRYGKPMCVGYLILLISYTTSATSTFASFFVSFVMTLVLVACPGDVTVETVT